MTLIYGQMNKSKLQRTMALFRNRLHIEGEKSPQYLVETIKLIEMNYTLTIVRRIVQMNPEWMIRNEHQTRKRIHRIIQTRMSFSYAFRAIESKIDAAIRKRRLRKTLLLNMSLTFIKTLDDNIELGVENDEKFDEDLSKSKNPQRNKRRRKNESIEKKTKRRNTIEEIWWTKKFTFNTWINLIADNWWW